MAEFDYVTWGGFDKVNKARLRKMSESDQYLKDLTDALPQGILGWSEGEADQNVSVATSPENLTDMGFSVTHTASRMIRVSFRSKGLKCSDDVTALIGLNVNGVLVATSILGLRKNVASGPFNLTYLYSPSATTKTYQIVGSNMNNPTHDVVFRATPTSPRQLIVEDVGAYVEPDAGG